MYIAEIQMRNKRRVVNWWVNKSIVNFGGSVHCILLQFSEFILVLITDGRDKYSMVLCQSCDLRHCVLFLGFTFLVQTFAYRKNIYMLLYSAQVRKYIFVLQKTGVIRPPFIVQIECTNNKLIILLTESMCLIS